MIQIDIIVLRRRTATKLDAWKCMTDVKGQLFARYDDTVMSAEEAWRRMALTIHDKARDAAVEVPYSHFEVDVFLLVRERLLEHLHAEDDLEKIFNAAHHHIWGGNIYLAWVRAREAADFKTLYANSESFLEERFRALIDLGITDLIEISEKDAAAGPDLYKTLHQSALKSEERLERLRKFVSDDAWKVVLHPEAFSIEAFIKRFLGETSESVEHKKIAVFYDKKPKAGGRQLLEMVPDFNHAGNLFVAVCSQRILHDLEARWKPTFPGVEIYYFNSILEWLYAFVRLNEACRPEAHKSITEQAQHDGNVEWVEASDAALVSSKPNTGDLHLLVTSACCFKREQPVILDQDEEQQEEQRCLDAATEIGEVRRKLPFHSTIEVHHCITCERLPTILKASSFTAWLHLDHSKREKRLKDGQTNQYASPANWTYCFHRYEASLQLVMFSACESAELARAFAKLGVPVAIGFENEFLNDAMRTLSAMVMPSALRAGDRQAAILEVFRNAAVELHITSYPWKNEEGRNEGKHFREAGPKAFAVKIKTP